MNTNDQNAIGTEQLQEGLAVLENLAQEEYGKDLASVLTDPTQNQEYRIQRVGRLLGIVLKEPFVTAVPIDPTVSYTGARRAWRLLDWSTFDSPEKKSTWQYGVLERLRVEELPSQLVPWNVSSFALSLQDGRGFFRYLAISIHKHICPDHVLDMSVIVSVPP